MATTSSIVSAALEGSSASRTEDISKLLIVTPQNTKYWDVITGLGGTQDKLRKMNLMDKFKSTVGKGLDPFNALGIARPDKVKSTTARDVQVTRGGTLPHKFTFTSADYTAANMNASPNNFDMAVANPGSLIPVGLQLQFPDDSNGAVQVQVKSVSEQPGGGAVITVKITSGTVGDDVTNSTTAKTLTSLGSFAGEGSDLQDNPYQTSTSETFNLGKMQRTISHTPEGGRTNYDTVDKVPFPTDKYAAMCSTMIREMNNNMVLASSASLVDPDNNAYNVPAGFMNFSGVESISASASGLGPTVLQQVAKEIIYDASSSQVPFDLGPGGKPILDIICDSTRSLLFDEFLKTSGNGNFGTQVMVKMGDDKFSTILNMYETRDAWLRVHHEESLDGSPYASTIGVFNANTIVPVIKDGFWFDTKFSPKDSNPNKHKFAITTIYGQAVLIPDQIKYVTGVTALES